MLQKNRPQKCKYQIAKSRASIALVTTVSSCVLLMKMTDGDIIIRPYAFPRGLIKCCVCPPVSVRPSRNTKAVETSNLLES